MNSYHSIPTRNDLLDLDDGALLGHCHQECFRAPGPGGQHKNKTDSAVRLSVLGGSITALCSDHRSQHRNRSEALKRLRSALAINLRMPIEPEGNSGVWQGPWKLGLKDHRYAKLLAHILDVMADNDWAVGLSANVLGTSTGKLVRLLSRDPHAWNAVNQARAKINLVNLRRP
ncbi:MAG: peptide chain release factor-like protein [Hellea sp.]